jgi:hypothetical protein
MHATKSFKMLRVTAIPAFPAGSVGALGTSSDNLQGSGGGAGGGYSHPRPTNLEPGRFTDAHIDTIKAKGISL